MMKTKSDFNNCLKNKRIIPSADAKNLAGKEMAESLIDLEEAQDRFEHGRYKYCTTTAYYAMFHAARALLYSQGYRERSHWCVLAAMEELFGKTGKLEMRLVRALGQAMTLREDADYAAEYSQKGAEQTSKNAKEFIEKAQEILKKK